MITPDYCRTMARYNAWMNDKVYAHAAALTPAIRKKNLGAFFKSVHGTLGHIVLGDGMWMRRFDAGCALPFDPMSVRQLDQELFAEFDDLRSARVTMDAAIAGVFANYKTEDFAKTLTYTRVNGTPMTLELGVAVAHFFNHQTHHRGQVTTLLSQLGIDIGETDLVWMPAAQS